MGRKKVEKPAVNGAVWCPRLDIPAEHRMAVEVAASLSGQSVAKFACGAVVDAATEVLKRRKITL